MKNGQAENIELIVGLLREKLIKHRNEVEPLSTQELLKIYEILIKDRPLAEYILITVINELEFLDNEYQTDTETHQKIEAFLYGFKDFVKKELSLSSRTNKDANRFP